MDTGHPNTGTRRLDLFSGDPVSCGVSPETAHGGGIAHSARYLSDHDSDGYCAEIVIYPILCDDGSWGVEEMATIGRAVYEDDMWRPDDSADITYEWASALAYDTLESAQEVADRIGKADMSWALELRPQEARA